MRNSGMAGIASGHVPEAPPRSAFPLTEESPKKPNRPRGLAALRDLSGGVIAGWIRPSNHDLCVAHAARETSANRVAALPSESRTQPCDAGVPRRGWSEP